MKKIKKLLLLGVIIIVTSCNDEDTNVTPTGLIYSYFPVNVGHEIIYDAVLITKNPFNEEHDTAIYQIKEVVESEFLDEQTRPTQRLERYRRDTPNDPWVISDVWTCTRTSSRVEKTEENINFVKLVFPINPNVTWNGNSLNIYEPQDYEYDQLHQPDVIGGISFDSTLTVLQMDDDNFVNTRLEFEKYAPGVGCIYKVHNYIVKDYSQFPFIGIDEQRLYSETIVSWSN